MNWQNNLLLLVSISAGVPLLITGLMVASSRVRSFRFRKKRLESAHAVEAVITATAAIDAAALSLKRMIEAVPGTTTAFTGQSATTAIEATTQAVLTILKDQPGRLQNAELKIYGLETGLKEMRELFNKLGK